MMVALWIAITVIIAFLKVLTSNGRTNNECSSPKDEREDCLSRPANFKIKMLILSVTPAAMCKNAIVEQMMRATEFKASVWLWIIGRR